MSDINRRHVLLVEDDREDYLITRDLLAEAPGPPFELEWTMTYEAALERLGQGGIDVVLVDYRLGSLSGLDLVREAGLSGHRPPMVLLTGQGDRDIDCQAMGAGAVDFLLKGDMTPAILERAIRYAIERRRSEEALRAARDELAESNIRLRREMFQRGRAENELARLAVEDSLTGLPNRALFLERLEQALTCADQPKRGVAVMFLDLDDFKAVNDSLGSSAGDRVLTLVAERLGSALRDGDTVARFGGDDFAILVDDIRDKADAAAVGRRLLAALRPPIKINDSSVELHASIGIAITSSSHDLPEHLLRKADVALYRAKADGKGRIALFEVQGSDPDSAVPDPTEPGVQHQPSVGPPIELSDQPPAGPLSSRLAETVALTSTVNGAL